MDRAAVIGKNQDVTSEGFLNRAGCIRKMPHLLVPIQRLIRSWKQDRK